MSLTNDEISSFLELLARQRAQYDRMRHDAEADVEFFSQMPQPAELDLLLERKRQAMEALAGLQGALAPYMARWAALRAMPLAARSQEIEAALTGVQESLRLLIAAEDAANKVAEETMLGARRRLRALASTGQAARAYGARAPSQAHFVDERP